MRGYSAFPRKGRPHWTITYLCAETGDWRQEATPFRLSDPTGKTKALRLAESKAAEYFRTRAGHRRESWAAWAPQFIREHAKGSPLTLGRYEQAWDQWRTFLADAKVHRPGLLTFQHVLDFIRWRTGQKKPSGRKVSRNTALLDVKVMGLVMREAVRRSFALTNPAAATGLRRDRPKEKAPLTAEEIARIRAALDKREGRLPITERWMTVSFEIALHQGCRLRETSLPLEDIDLERRTITFRAKGRNGEPHVFTTALNPALLPLVQELRAARSGLTCTLPRFAAKEWWQLRKEIGLGHTTFHATRVTVVTRLARQGVPIQQAMRFVGHSSRIVHQIYQKLAAEDLSKCTAALDFSAPPTRGTRRAAARKP
ncbi:MAG TPA: tyrosine-type recombinase/integrase [Opitutaceae bacterium]|nr:tyrosine-type recombinase/integrase [Opitutaceae bacterium]